MQNGSNRAEPPWDAQDVARYLKVSRSWVYHRAESGELPSLKIAAYFVSIAKQFTLLREGFRRMERAW